MMFKQARNAKNFGKKIGLLGGSFNPAHEGHLAMSLHARERLCLDEIWWLVSPQNPLKSKENMAPLSERLSRAKTLARAHKWIVPSALEVELGTVYTVDTVRAIKTRSHENFFVWLMGEDNLASFHLWKSWEEIFCLLPIAVFRRSGYSMSRQRSRAAEAFAQAKRPLAAASSLAVSPPPVWVVLDNTLNPESATRIRRASQPTCMKELIMVAKKKAVKKPAAKKVVKKVVKKVAKKKVAKKK